MPSTNARRKEKRENAKKNGICSYCLRNPAKLGKLCCEKCANKAKGNYNRSATEAKEKGFCYRCKHRIPDNPNTMCNNCIEKEKTRSLQRYYARKLIVKNNPNLCKKCGCNDRFGTLTCCKKCNIQRKNNRRGLDKKLKLKAFDNYGGRHCNCCGENTIEFLTIDHLNNDGSEHRKIIGNKLYEWLRKNNYPPGFAVRCYNCNLGRDKTKDKICPHCKKIDLIDGAGI